MTQNIASQRQRVFENAVDDMKQSHSMSALDFAVALLEIFYKLKFEETERYPVSIVLPEYYTILKPFF